MMNTTVMIEQLNRDFSIDGVVTFTKGKGDLPNVSIHSASCTATISLLGGQVLSFTPAGQQQNLMFVSDNAHYQNGKAIKGGAPICWPWFGSHAKDTRLPFHGFVRNRLWQVQSIKQTEQDNINITLVFDATDETRNIWPYEFRLVQVITLSDSLAIELQSHNTGAQSFELTQAIHTYFYVGDIQQTQVIGLDNKSYQDKVENFAAKTQTGPVRFSGETDRIYQDVSYPLEIHDDALERKIIIESTGSSTAVVWNPWVDIAKTSADLGDNDYKHFLCVETANAADEVILVESGQCSRLLARYKIK